MYGKRIGYAVAALSIFAAGQAACAVPALDSEGEEEPGEAAPGGAKTAPGGAKTPSKDPGGAATPPGPPTPAPGPVTPQGCITKVSAGQHRFSCDGLAYDVMVPAACAAGGCGLVLDVHGATMSAAIEDSNTNMRALGTQKGFVVVQPNALPAPPLQMTNWNPATDDDKVLALVKLARTVFQIDAKRVHMTGFSSGGAMAFRILCKHADAFASIAAAAGPGCTFAAGDMPSREVPLLYMQGTRDKLENYQSSAIPQRDKIIAGWKMGPGAAVAGDAKYKRTRYTSPSGTAFEFIQHDYVASAFLLGGHCYPGSSDPGNAQGQMMPFGCTGTTAFAWGEEAMAFFLAHPGK
jgi:polyhydroxybutyrate depolymerase